MGEDSEANIASPSERTLPRACPECAASVALRHRSVLTTPRVMRIIRVLTVLVVLSTALWLAWSYRTASPSVTTGELSRELKTTMAELSAIARGETDPATTPLRDRLQALLGDNATMRQEASLIAYRDSQREHRTRWLRFGWPIELGSVMWQWHADTGRPQFDQRLPLPENYAGQEWTWEWLGVYRSWRMDNWILAVSGNGTAFLQVGLLVFASTLIARRAVSWWSRRRQGEQHPPSRPRRWRSSPSMLVCIGCAMLLIPHVRSSQFPFSAMTADGTGPRFNDLIGSNDAPASDAQIAKSLLTLVHSAPNLPQPNVSSPLGENVRLMWSYRWGFSSVHLTWPSISSFAYCTLGWRTNRLIPPPTSVSQPGTAASSERAFPVQSWRFRTTAWGEWELFFPVAPGGTTRFSMLMNPLSVIIHAIGLGLAVLLALRGVTLLVAGRTSRRWRNLQCVNCGYDLRGIIDPAERSS